MRLLWLTVRSQSLYNGFDNPLEEELTYRHALTCLIYYQGHLCPARYTKIQRNCRHYNCQVVVSADMIIVILNTCSSTKDHVQWYRPTTRDITNAKIHESLFSQTCRCCPMVIKISSYPFVYLTTYFCSM